MPLPSPKIIVILEGVIYNDKRFSKEIEKQLRSVQEGARLQLKKTTDTWKKQPKFFVRKIKERGQLGYEAGTENQLWNMLDQGTEEHDIPASGKALKFGLGSSPKTTPGLLSSGPGGFAGGDELYRKTVHHPGTEARRWTYTIAKEMRRKFREIMQASIDDWVDDEHRRGPGWRQRLS